MGILAAAHFQKVVARINFMSAELGGHQVIDAIAE